MSCLGYLPGEISSPPTSAPGAKDSCVTPTMIRIDCSHCIFGKVRTQTHTGSHISPCSKCSGKAHRWVPHGMTEGDYDAILGGNGDGLESIINGLTVERPGGI